ncbi:MAG: bleomycin resistance protein [Cytophagaceae bacterium]|nr:bleomycin resistance protein [Cytophagaceae bacterium]
MAIEIVNWLEIPYVNLKRAKHFYETLFDCQLVDMAVGEEMYPCFPNKNDEGFSGALVQYDFTKPGKNGPLVYLNAYGQMDVMISKIEVLGGKIIQEKKEIAPGFGYFMVFEDSEGNQLALQE